MKNISYSILVILITFSVNLLSNETTEEQKMLLESLPPDQREAIKTKMETANKIQGDLEEVFEEGTNLIERPDKETLESDCEECILLSMLITIHLYGIQKEN